MMKRASLLMMLYAAFAPTAQLYACTKAEWT